MQAVTRRPLVSGLTVTWPPAARTSATLHSGAGLAAAAGIPGPHLISLVNSGWLSTDEKGMARPLHTP
jgi:hypothetical protein